MENVSYVSILPPHMVFVNKTPDTSSNLTGKQDDQAGKELERRENIVIMNSVLFSSLYLKSKAHAAIMLFLKTNNLLDWSDLLFFFTVEMISLFNF